MQLSYVYGTNKINKNFFGNLTHNYQQQHKKSNRLQLIQYIEPRFILKYCTRILK